MGKYKIVNFVLRQYIKTYTYSMNSYSNTKVYINCTPSRNIIRRNGSAPTQSSSPLLTPLHSANNNGHGNGSSTHSNNNNTTSSTNSGGGYLLSPLNSPKPGRRSLNSVGSASTGNANVVNTTPHRQSSLTENTSNNELLSSGNGQSVTASPNSQPYWKSRLNNLKNSFLLGTPR